MQGDAARPGTGHLGLGLQRPLLPPKSTLSSRLDDFTFLDGCEPALVDTFLSETEDWNKLLLLAVSSPNLSCRQWVWQQYDHMVQSNTMVGPGSDAAVVRVKGTKKALAMTLDGPGYRVARNPREGAKLAFGNVSTEVQAPLFQI